jgi:tetratricopeptide (TPR) repeat protein
MRGILASALSLKGEHEKAVEALLFESANLSKFYSPGDMASVGATDEGSKLIELQSKKIEGIFQPIRLLLLASVYNAGEEFQKAEQVLDQVDKALGPEPVIRASYYRNRAFCSAGKGQVALALGYIEQTRSLTSQSSRRSAIWDSHFVIGRAYIYLGRFKEAFAELCVAEQSALHPIEKHRTSYWLGRACQADGVPDKAKAYYEAVAASAIPSWMRKSAADALARGI